PLGSSNVPVFISTDGGQTWALTTAIITGTTGTCVAAVCDITPRFALNSGTVYFAWLNPTAAVEELQVAGVSALFTAPALTNLETRSGASYYPDQPYISASSVLGG